MSVQAEPRLLETPVPGGAPGSAVTVEPMVTGTFSSPDILHENAGGEVGSFKVLRASRGENTPVPIPAFLIRHPSYGPILVDTGLHPSIASDPVQNLGRFSTRLMKPQMNHGQDVSSQLRAKGVDPGSIRLVIMTHLHIDHASGIADFPDATFIVTANEWEAATSGVFAFTKGYHRPQFDYAFDFRTVSYDGDSVNSYASFGRTIDLFGDGSIRLASTPGHTAGHQSVIVRLKNDDLVIGGDAFYLEKQLEPRADLPGRTEDRHNFKRSLQEMRLFHSQYPNSVITPGHDPEFYEKAPEKYE
ncbi:MAG: N-acyl homoserine lactonase family protein [Solirubrobacterales bacterium]